MRLYHSPTSPYVRKVLVAAIELGLEERIERVPTQPWDSPEGLLADNPLSKVPCLVTDDGTALYDSPVICAYLLSLVPRAAVPEAERWAVERRHALADGILDAAVLRRLEANRPDGERSPSWGARQAAAVRRGVDALEAEADAFTGDDAPRLDRVAVACALGYLDFRFADEPWRDGRPRLAGWFEGVAGRPSMRATAPAG